MEKQKWAFKVNKIKKLDRTTGRMINKTSGRETSSDSVKTKRAPNGTRKNER